MTSAEKMEVCFDWMGTKMVVCSSVWKYGNLLRAKGVITEVGPGVWGYGGDSVAVKIDGEWFPAENTKPFISL